MKWSGELSAVCGRMANCLVNVTARNYGLTTSLKSYRCTYLNVLSSATSKEKNRNVMI